MERGENPRLLGVAVPNVSDWQEPQPTGKWSQFFGALGRRGQLAGVIRAEVPRADLCLNAARTFHASKRRWFAQAGFNEWLATRRTATVQRGLAAYASSYDAIIQLQTLCAPGSDRGDVPYAIYTDSTMALVQRHYRAAAMLSERRASGWMSFEADICRNAAVVFTISEFARSSVVDDYGCLPDSVIAVGAGTNQMLPDLPDKDYSVPRALFVGIDFQRKGGEVLLQAWPMVRAQIPDAELMIVGPKRQPRSVPPGIDWMGPVDRERLSRLYQAAAVFVLPSLFEPWGFVFFEAMGHGIPCIGTSSCAMPEMIDDHVTGRLVPSSEVEPLAQALIELLSDPVKAAAMGQAAYRHVIEGNSWGDVADRILTHLGGALGATGGRPRG